MIGRSPAMARLRHEIDVVASSELNVLILGETGVGKELIAKAVHGGSPRAHAPWSTSTAPPCPNPWPRASCSAT
jgi:anaerobic nitric oxide reductase transcription regulator